jgi:hypothetical protein
VGVRCNFPHVSDKYFRMKLRLLTFAAIREVEDDGDDGDDGVWVRVLPC